MRPIDANAICCGCPSYEDCKGECWSENECEIYDVLIKAPTLDYKDLVPQGEWIKRPDERICPFCNDRYSYFGGKEKNFCPNCGARMKGAD